MTATRPTRRSASADGFTLIEILVVILVLAILIAVAAPSFLGQTEKAHDSAVKQNLTVAYKAAKTEAVEREGQFVNASFSAAQLASSIAASEPQFTVATGDCPTAAAADVNHIVVDTVDNDPAVVDHTAGDDLILCADPARRVWTLKVVDGGAPQISGPTLVEESAAAPAPPSYSDVVLADGPAAYWRLGADPTLDSSASGAHALIPAITPVAAPGLVSGADGSRTFVDNSNYMRATDSAALSSGAVTVEAWIKPTVLNGNGGWNFHLVHKGSYNLGVYGDGRVYFTISSGGSSATMISPIGTIANGNIYHVVATSSATSARVYVNGIQVDAGGLGALDDTTAPVYISSHSGFNAFAGEIDEVAIYGTALSLGRVQAHYDAR